MVNIGKYINHTVILTFFEAIHFKKEFWSINNKNNQYIVFAYKIKGNKGLSEFLIIFSKIS